MNKIQTIQKWDQDFFKKFSSSQRELELIKEGLLLAKSFMAFLLTDKDSGIISRFIIYKTSRSELFLGYYINTSSDNFLIKCRDSIINFNKQYASSELVGPINFNIFNKYRYTYDLSEQAPDADSIKDFEEFGFKINQKWFLMSYSRSLGLLRLLTDMYKTLTKPLELEVRSTASLEDIYNIVTYTYKGMPYFEDPGLNLFKQWNQGLLSHHKDDEKIFYYKNDKLVAFCLFKRLSDGLNSRVTFSHIGRVSESKVTGITRDIHLRISKLEKFRTLINPPLFDLIHEKSPIFNYLPINQYKLHATYVTMAFSL